VSNTPSVNFKDHISVVTSLDYQYPIENNKEYGYCLLSSGVDNSVKLWNLWSDKPLISFNFSDDLIGDVKWNPSNRCLFACGDSKG